MTIHNNKIWIGLIHVVPKSNNDILREGEAAYAQAVARATSIDDFQAIVLREIDEYGLSLLSFEEAEPLSSRIERFSVDKSIHNLINEVKETYTIRFGSFHVYPLQDSDRPRCAGADGVK